MRLELRGLEVFAHHGVLAEEQEKGQPFWFDVELEVDEAAVSDRIEDAVDYRAIVACVRERSGAHRYDLLEALVAAVADGLLARFPARKVWVRVRKRPADLPVEWSAASIVRTR